jgi:alkyl hydroperoxide reductase subunit AhpC
MQQGGIKMAIRIGEKVPDFETEAYVNSDIKKVKLSNYKGKWVVLFFYPLDRDQGFCKEDEGI